MSRQSIPEGQTVYIDKRDLLRAHEACDLGESRLVSVYFYPHKDVRPYLVKCETKEEADAGE